MTMDKSLRVRAGMIRARNVLTRDERIARLRAADRWQEGDSPFGLAKVRVYKLAMKKKKKKKKEEEEGEGAAAEAARRQDSRAQDPRARAAAKTPGQEVAPRWVALAAGLFPLDTGEMPVPPAANYRRRRNWSHLPLGEGFGEGTLGDFELRAGVSRFLSPLPLPGRGLHGQPLALPCGNRSFSAFSLLPRTNRFA